MRRGGLRAVILFARGRGMIGWCSGRCSGHVSGLMRSRLILACRYIHAGVKINHISSFVAERAILRFFN